MTTTLILFLLTLFTQHGTAWQHQRGIQRDTIWLGPPPEVTPVP